MTKQTKLIAGLTAFLSSFGLALVLLVVIPNIENVAAFAKNNSLLAPLILIAWRILAIVIPPIPGSMLSYALLPVFGWWESFIYSAIGVLIGTSTAFWLARRFRERLVGRFLPLRRVHELQGRMSSKTEFLVFLGFMLVTSPISDFMSYVAGLSKISFLKFISAVAISILPNIFIYYVGEAAFRANIYLGTALLLSYAIIFYFLKKKDIFSGKL